MNPTDCVEMVQLPRPEYERLLRERAAFNMVREVVGSFAATVDHYRQPSEFAHFGGQVSAIVLAFNVSEAERMQIVKLEVIVNDSLKEPETP